MIAGLALVSGISPRELRELPVADLLAMGRVLDKRTRGARARRPRCPAPR